MSEPKQTLLKQELDVWLDTVNYTELNSNGYVPSQFALMFMNFIKMVNGGAGESDKTPPFHLAMLDKVTNDSTYVANLCFRGAAKTTVFMEYLCLFVGVFHYLPGIGDIDGMIYVSDSMDNGVASARKNIEFRYKNSEFLQEWLPEARFTEKYIEFENKNGEKLGIKMFGAKTGLRGTKIFGKRPVLAILDDLISNDDANSKVSMQSIFDTIYKDVMHALDPKRRKIVFNGTPFNKEDVLVKAIESGQWDVNVWPVCERWPCTEDEYVGAWPDRFPWHEIKKSYDLAVGNGQTASFFQEMMLRIGSGDDRLVDDHEIQWYSKVKLLENKRNFNFYITTDFATSEKQTADFSAISVWAINANGDWFWVDGMHERQTMDKNIDQLFRFVSSYKPQSVGIEVTGQQGGFIPWLQSEMMSRNIWFTFASSEVSNKPGIRPIVDKLSRFNLVVPLFKMRKMFFPNELKMHPMLKPWIDQIKLATRNGIKGKDDALDTISMLAFIKAWRPSETPPITDQEDQMWREEHGDDDETTLSNYIV